MECLESSRFQCNLLNSITIVDSPGVLSAHQSKDRSYDFPGVVEWFAERSDLILFFFDPEKLDISEEMHRVIAKLNGHESKLRIILNKMDKVDELDLVKVFGSLMWSLGRCFPGADMVRVYMGCYGAPVNPQHSHNAALVQRDCALLADDLAGLVKDAPVRKVNRLVKREKQMEMADNLDAIYEAVQIRYDFSLGDFPDKVKFRPYLEEVDLSEVKKLKKGMIESLDMILDVEAPRLFQLLPGGVAENFE
ncbi:EHD2, partial [Symbiodinium microadriaticum]